MRHANDNSREISNAMAFTLALLFLAAFWGGVGWLLTIVV